MSTSKTKLIPMEADEAEVVDNPEEMEEESSTTAALVLATSGEVMTSSDLQDVKVETFEIVQGDPDSAPIVQLIVMSFEQAADMITKDSLLLPLSLTFVQVEDWLVVQRTQFELRVDNHVPFRAMEFFFQPRSGKFHRRVFGKTVGVEGVVKDADSFRSVVATFFTNTLPCVGAFGHGKIPNGFIRVLYPFNRYISEQCQFYYSKNPLDNNRETGLCDVCLQAKVESDAGMTSTSATTSSAADIPVYKIKPEPQMTTRRNRKKATHPCTQESCQAQLDSKASLERHLKENHFYGDFECGECGEKSEYATSLFEHHYEKEHESIFACPICKDPFEKERLEEFKLHYALCVIAFPDEVKAKDDQQQQQESTMCPMPNCAQVFQTDNLMQAHIKLKHLKGDFKCRHCTLQFDNADDLFTHNFTGHRNRESVLKFFCPLKCSTSFLGRSKKAAFINHFLQCSMMSDQDRYKQKKRGYYFKLKATGYFDNRPPSEKKFQCDMCGKAYRSRPKLQEHIYWHRGERPLKCEQEGCDFSTHSKNALQYHQVLHLRDTAGVTQVGRFKLLHPCDQCERTFKTPGSLKYHKRHVHDGIKEQYACQDCGQMYATVKSLRRHRMTTHDSTSIYTCGVCGKTCTAEFQLKAHMKTHSDQKFTCGVCSKQFNFQHRLTEHERIHTGETPYECEFCGHKTKSSSVMGKHKQARHKDEILKSARKKVGTVVANN